ncbi:hypothetical protein FMM01_07875 [Schleiferilactobacillus harbinensis]|uniref:hypothetical protein n=1 Tax=Schleiferilactobacillus harbinensis TaxID=304207 RepID=UPI0012395896|nr:hypothetical protein [Schleiferilactobacillus harbinensis]QEU47217.1 hypothetical protein FMM01_07875 [Schleiferilactobacillus harbinensis]
MAEETDFLLRQIKGIAGQLGYILGKRAEGTESAIIFPANKPPLPYQDVLRELLHTQHYQEALTKFTQIRYAMEQDDYVKNKTTTLNWGYGSMPLCSNCQRRSELKPD